MRIFKTLVSNLINWIIKIYGVTPDEAEQGFSCPNICSTCQNMNISPKSAFTGYSICSNCGTPHKY